MHPVFRLVKDDAVFRIRHLIGYFFSSMGRQAVHEDVILLRPLDEFGIDLVGFQDLHPLLPLLLFAHAGPYIRIDNVSPFNRLFRVLSHLDFTPVRFASSFALDTTLESGSYPFGQPRAIFIPIFAQP